MDSHEEDRPTGYFTSKFFGQEDSLADSFLDRERAKNPERQGPQVKRPTPTTAYEKKLSEKEIGTLYFQLRALYTYFHISSIAVNGLISNLQSSFVVGRGREKLEISAAFDRVNPPSVDISTDEPSTGSPIEEIDLAKPAQQANTMDLVLADADSLHQRLDIAEGLLTSLSRKVHEGGGNLLFWDRTSPQGVKLTDSAGIFNQGSKQRQTSYNLDYESVAELASIIEGTHPDIVRLRELGLTTGELEQGDNGTYTAAFLLPKDVANYKSTVSFISNGTNDETILETRIKVVDRPKTIGLEELLAQTREKMQEIGVDLDRIVAYCVKEEAAISR